MKRILILCALLAGCAAPNTQPHPDVVDVAPPASATPARMPKAPGQVVAVLQSLLGGPITGRGATDGQTFLWDATQHRWEPGTISTTETQGWDDVLAIDATSGARTPTIASGQALRLGGATANDVRMEQGVDTWNLALRLGDDSAWSGLEAGYVQAMNASSALKAFMSAADVGFFVADTGRVGWSSNTSAAGSPDTGLQRISAALLAVNDGNGTATTDWAGLALDNLIVEANTTSGIKFKVTGGVLVVREGDDSADAPFQALSLTLTTALSVSYGGTGQTTQTAAFDALDPLTTQGDLAYHNGTNTVRLGTGTAGQVLTSGGAGADLSWSSVAGGSLWITLLPQHGIQPASNPATFNVRNNHSLLEFDQTTAESIIYEITLPDSYASGSNLTVKIYWGTTATTGNCIWQVQVEYIDDGTLDLDADSFDTAVDSSADAASGTSGVLTTTTLNLSNGAADDIIAGAPMRLTITRKAADGSDTLAADAQVFFVTVEQ